MSAPQAEAEAMLAEDLARTYDDPLGWVRWAFEWGQGEIAASAGPRTWQRESLERIGAEVRKRDRDGTRPAPPIQMSTASGHGIGKSALTAWIILWLLSTRPRAKGVVTANTSDQLRTKTWGELAKWHRLSLVRDMFAYHGGKGHLSLVSTEQPQLWRCDGMTCREENSEAFAGLHAADSTPFYIFDEASAVPDAIWDVALGGLTDGEPMFFAFGNPTRNTGRFRETHGSLKHRWITRQIDSRTVEGTNKALFAEWEEDFGEDGDFFRVRVRGLFPRASSLQFIDSDAVAAAMKRAPAYGSDDPLVLGIDIARGGDDNNVIWFRRGMDARTIPPIRVPGKETRDTTRMIAKIVTVIEDHGPDGVFIDGTGIGGPLVDRIRQLGFDVFEVQFGGAAPDRKYANMAAYMWARMKDALNTGLALPEDATLEAELTTREYTHNAKDQLVLERKEDMKKRGLASPDNADALALTFALPVVGRGQAEGQEVGKAIKDYDPLAE